jgi:predicted PurR-regulated permease PerM
MDAKVSNVTVILIAMASFIIVVAGMRAAAAIVNPFLLSIFLAILLSPPLFWLQRQGVPNALAISAIILVLLVVVFLLVVFVGRSVQNFSQQLPAYQARLSAIMASSLDYLGSLGLDLSKSPLTDFISPGKAMRVTANLLTGLTGLFTNMFFIMLTVILILLEASVFPQKIQEAFPDPEKIVGQFRTFMESVNRYLVIKTLFSLATGIFIWLWLAVLGVDFAPTWGMVAFFLNFVPNIGSIIAAVPAILLALIQLGVPSALLACLGFAAVNILFGNILEPRFMGRGLGMSTLVVFISLIFWGWVLGTIGMVLSIPLTMIVKIALASDEGTRWIAIMLD